MNENIDLIEILKNCPKGTKLFSYIHGEVEFDGIEPICHQIRIIVTTDNMESYQ